MTGPVLIDITRLLRAAWRATPSGVERVEFAYAQHYRARGNVMFAAANLHGAIRIIPLTAACAFLDLIHASWRVGGRRRRLRLAAAACQLRLLATPPPPPLRAAVLLVLAHENLANPAGLAAFTARTGARLVCFVHDLIPLTHAEYARPGQARTHARCMLTAAGAAAVITSSAAVKADFTAFAHRHGGAPPVHVAPLGIEPPAPLPAPHAAAARPFFICIATIEPRKNHLLLLHLWRQFASLPAPPRLLVIGRRGWENEMVLDMLDRASSLAGLVEEHAGISDTALAALLDQASALLLPSFAEGFGLPVVEALAAGTPVICADLPALREAAGDVPDYLDPLDGPAWRAAIFDYAAPHSLARAAQIARMRQWRAPSWTAHFAAVTPVVEALHTA